MSLVSSSSQSSPSIAFRLEKLQKLHQVLTKKDKSDKDISTTLKSLKKIDQAAIRQKIAIQGTGSSKAMLKEKLIRAVKGQMKKLSPLKTDVIFQANVQKSNPFSRVSPDLQTMGIGPFLCPKDLANFRASFKDTAAIQIASHIIKKNALDSLIETYLHRSCADLIENEKIQALHELMCMANRLSEIEELLRPNYSSLQSFFHEVEARNLIRMMEKIHQDHPFPNLPKGVKNLKIPKDAPWTVLKAKRLRHWMKQHKEFSATIERLNFEKCQLSLLPKEIGLLKALNALGLGHNRLTSVSKEIGQLKALQVLDLSHNHLASMPKEIGLLKALRVLLLESNHLASLPKEIGLLKALQWLCLDSNHLASLPKEIGQLQALQLLKLSDNNLASVSKEIGQLKALQELGLNHNHLASLPKEIGQLQALEWLLLESNHLASLPKEFGQLQALQWLLLNNNHLASVPEEISQLQALQSLKLNDNGLINIPASLARFTFDPQKQNKELQLKTILKKLTLCVTGRHDTKQIAELLNIMETLPAKSFGGKLKDPKFGRKAFADLTINPRLKAAAIERFRIKLENGLLAKNR